MKNLKRVLSCILILAMCFGLAACGGGSKTAMVINGEEISQGIMDFYYNYGAAQFSYYGIDINGEGYESYRTVVEEQAIDIAKESAIIRSAAKERELTYDAADLENMEQQEIEYLGGEEAYEAWLTENGVAKDDIRWILETQLYTEALYAELTKGITAADDELQAEYAAHPENYDTISVSHILFVPEDKEADASWAAALDEAKAALGRLANGEDFATLAKELSDDGSAANGGALGTEFTAANHNFVKEFADACFKLEKVGDISEPVKSEFGYHIIKLDTKVTGWENLRADIEYALVGEEKDNLYYDFITEAYNTLEISKDYARKYPADATDDTESGNADAAGDAEGEDAAK